MSDPGIEALSKKATEEQAACPVTLVVSGNMVTGHIVARDTFEADTTRMVEMAQEQAEGDDAAVEAMGELISAMLNEVGGSDDGTFVHVSVQEVMTGAEAIHLGGSVFRFRTSEIEGYTIGTVETREG
jgi:D-alanyl-D-alanine carboxypeptidase